MERRCAPELLPLPPGGRESFIDEVQAAFAVAAREEFGPDAGEAIPRRDVESSLDAPGAEVYRLACGGRAVGGAVVVPGPDGKRASLDLLYIRPGEQGAGLGLAAWRAIERLHPQVELWETHTPYFERRNIHFYVNKCGFHIVEFFCPAHPEPHGAPPVPGGEYFFRFEKRVR